MNECLILAKSRKTASLCSTGHTWPHDQIVILVIPSFHVLSSSLHTSILDPVKTVHTMGPLHYLVGLTIKMMLKMHTFITYIFEYFFSASELREFILLSVTENKTNKDGPSDLST